MQGVNKVNTNIFKDHFPQPSSVCSVNRHSEDTSAGYVLSAVHANTPELCIKPWVGRCGVQSS